MSVRLGRAHAALVGAVACGGAGLFAFVAFRTDGDIAYHAQFIVDLLERGVVPVDVVYWYAVALLSGFSRDVTRVTLASVPLLALALAWKYHLTARLLADWSEEDAPGAPLAGAAREGLALALLVLFCFPLPGMHWYLGQFPPNVWHNSTTVVLMPVALLLFGATLRYFESGGGRALARVTGYTALSVVTKPSLFFGFAPAFALFALVRERAPRRLLRAALPLLAGGALLAAYVAVIFYSPAYRAISEGQGGGMALGFFETWRRFSPNVPASVANSLLVPLLVFCGYPDVCRRDLRVRFAATLLACGLLLFAVVQETGDRALHGNLLWQTIVGNYLLHVAVVAAFVRAKREAPGLRPFDWVIGAAFAAQVVAGLAYLVKIAVTRSYV